MLHIPRPAPSPPRSTAPPAPAPFCTVTRLHLSPPHQTGDELTLVQEAISSNWMAPLGPMVDAFEREFAEAVGAPHAVAVASGTAALHLSLLAHGVGPGDEVLTSTLTFAASAFAVRYVGATPVFIDCDATTWTMDIALLDDALRQRARRGRLPKAVLPVHLYGQACDVDAIRGCCDRWGIAVIDDAAEAVGTRYRERPLGASTPCAAWSFNGNKIITSSGGGMLTTHDPDVARQARKLATQAREPAPHYEHAAVGYNYRLSNISAAIGLGQLRTLEDRVAARRAHFAAYERALSGLPGLSFAQEADWGRHTRWLTCCLIDPGVARTDRESVRLALEAADIEARPVWKPMHEQPVFGDCEQVGGAVASRLFRHGLCLPSGTGMSAGDRERTIAVMREVLG